MEENVEHHVLLFHHRPEVMKLTVDPNEGFVQMPLPRQRRMLSLGAAMPRSAKSRSTSPHAQAKHVIWPNGVADDFSRKATTLVRIG
jgi:hypothetical protein